jgi:hypothetical protein
MDGPSAAQTTTQPQNNGMEPWENRNMNLQTTTFSMLAALALMLGNTSQAATIASYDFNTDANPNTEAANSSPSATTGTGFLGSGRSSSSLSFFGRGISTSAVTSYISFTITADNGYVLDLDQLDFDYHFQQDQGGSQDQVTFEVRSSVDNFASAVSGTYEANPTTATGSTLLDATFDLSGGTYDDLASIEFRLYATNDTETHNNDIVRWDNIVVSGDVTTNAIPEPASLASGLFGLALIAARRRR